ncbi:hypothetical protein EVB55_174 [Rhizobium phage RHph_Y68]|uniref:Uncharacterized protein n=1 Tax=Rhizobium phage RHph_Y68 TaxID=2509787 RepID=A0A7S5USZ9_9CAUD|nr:hypothetical protein PP934_gp174 [Rhizobium phage RHph_Y68]QIG68109.1 hypothetical protein EVB55_174 [Rhizobium phage RHph_Y68]
MRISEIARLLEEAYQTVVVLSKNGTKATKLIREIDAEIRTTKCFDAATRRRRYNNGSVLYAGTPGTDFRGIDIQLILVLDDVSKSDIEKLKFSFAPILDKMIVESEEMPFLPFFEL